MPEVRESEDSQSRRLAELDRLLNDPDEPVMHPARVWSLLAELTACDLGRPLARTRARH